MNCRDPPFAEKERRWAKSGSLQDGLSQLPPSNHRYTNADGRYLIADGRFNGNMDARWEPPRARRKTVTSDWHEPALSRTKRKNPSSSPKSKPNAATAFQPSSVPRKPLSSGESNPSGSSPLSSPPTSNFSSQEKGCPVRDPRSCKVRLNKSLRAHGQSLSKPQPASGHKPEQYHASKAIKLPMDERLKALLVDDWENVTKNNQLVPLPHKHPVNKILNDYVKREREHRVPQSPEADIVEEVIAGLREYFNACLGRILLYKFERKQYMQLYQKWQEDPGFGHKAPGDTYGAEHLIRLISKLPELIVQTNMDQQSVNRLREEIGKFAHWLAKHSTKYFVSEYETPGKDYIAEAKSTG